MRRERELEDLIGCQALNEAGPAGRGSFYERLGLTPAGTAPPRRAPKAAPARPAERPPPVSMRGRRLNTTQKSPRTAPKLLSVTSVR